MKTFYFSGYWEERWECGDGCCSGGGVYIINFDCIKERGVVVKDQPYLPTCFSKLDVLIFVYEYVYDNLVPAKVFETRTEKTVHWLTQKLKERDVFVVIDIDGEENE